MNVVSTFTHDGAVVGYLVYGASHYGVHDADVPGPELVQVVALPMSSSAFPQSMKFVRTVI